MHVKYLIIGNNVAGINAAKTLASDVPDGEIVVYSKEPYHYYNRWELPAFLAGEKDLESIYFYPPGWYQTRGIEVSLDTEVTRLHPEAQQVTLNNGQQISYDYLLLCTGSRITHNQRCIGNPGLCIPHGKGVGRRRRPVGTGGSS
jgi:nitrite reductase (NADH) large subunit